MKAVVAFPILLSTVLAGEVRRCPPTGPVLPSPVIPSTFTMPDVVTEVNKLLNSSSPSWNASTTSFSVEITSADDTLLSLHRTAPIRNETGTDEVTTDTVYRIASITKVFATLELLLHAERYLDSPVTQFVPELQGALQYENITLRMLASHVAGVPRDSNPFDLYVASGEELQDAGFPVPDPSDIPTCDVPGSQPCPREELLNLLRSEPLVWKAGQRPGYSNLAFIILAYALETITGKTFSVLLKESISTPLGLSHTRIDPPEDGSRAIIPAGPGGFVMGYDIGNYNATAGLYSTPSDISKFIRAILNNTFLSPTQTQQWLKPSTFAESFSTSVGMPWEIFRLSNLTPDKRPIDLYTKSGGIFGYNTQMIIIPEFNVGLSILAAGDDSYQAVLGLLDVVIPAVVSSFDQLARAQAIESYAGRYQLVGDDQTDHSGEATLTLVINDGPGLKLEQWTNRGKSILDFLASQQGTTPSKLEARLYPVGEKDRWRMGLETMESANLSLFSDICNSWLSVDQIRYAKLPVDEFQFHIENGSVKGIENRGLRVNLTKIL